MLGPSQTHVRFILELVWREKHGKHLLMFIYIYEVQTRVSAAPMTSDRKEETKLKVKTRKADSENNMVEWMTNR